MRKASERENRYFRFLKRLRAGGRSNMYGAIPYLSAAFGCDRNEAFRIVCEWVDAEAAALPESERPAPRRQAVAVPAEPEPSLFDSSPAPGPAPVAAPARRTRAVATDRRTRAPVPAAASGKQRVARKKPAKGRKASRGKAA